MTEKKSVKKATKKKVITKVTSKKRGTVLTPRQLEFCYEFVANKGNGSAAARAVGIAQGNAKVQASKWLTKTNVRAKIHQIYAKHFKTLSCKSTDVLRELQTLGFSSITDFVEWNTDGEVILKNVEDIENNASAIKELKIENNENAMGEKSQKILLRLHDKIKPLEILGKHSGELDIEDDEDPDTKIVVQLTREDLKSKNASDVARDYNALRKKLSESKKD